MTVRTRLLRHFLSRWQLLVAAVVCAYSLALLANAFYSRDQLRSAAEQRIVADSKRRAAAVADLISARRNGVSALAESPEIENYLVNRALGMSLRYGLSANLYAVEARFRHHLQQDKLRGDPLYERIVLYDESGGTLVDLAPERGSFVAPPQSSAGPTLVIDPQARQIVVGATVMWKGEAHGRVVALGDIGALYNELFGGDARADFRELLVTAEGRELPATTNDRPVEASLAKSLAGLQENSLTPVSGLPGSKSVAADLIALRTEVASSGLSLVTLASAQTVYGQITSQLFLILASAFPLILLAAMFMFERMRRVQTALAQSEQRFRTIFENIRDGICIQDPVDHAILEVNPRMMAMYGYGPLEMTRLTQADIGANASPYGPEEWAAKQALAESGSPQFFPWQARRKSDQLFWVEISLFFISIEAQRRIVVVARDITQRMAQEQELVKALEYQRELNRKIEETRNQLLQSEKMASIGQLAAGVAHEINNPVGFVRSNMHTLHSYVGQLMELIDAYEQAEATVAEPNAALERARAIRARIDLDFLREDLRSVFDDSSQGIERVIKIVNDLKDFSHVDREEKWNLDDLHKGLEITLSVIWNELKYKCEVKKEYGELPLVECLIFQLNQVFMNILLNAAQAIERRGTITIRTGSAGDSVWIEIADDGKGIAPANLARIFDPFFTTKPVGQGTGLGLSISYSIIKKHHGTIDVDSREGRGTTFRISLPVVQPAAQRERD